MIWKSLLNVSHLTNQRGLGITQVVPEVITGGAIMLPLHGEAMAYLGSVQGSYFLHHLQARPACGPRRGLMGFLMYHLQQQPMCCMRRA